jgi:3-oxoacyl-[acyl-carrier protein] reductase
MLNQKVAVVTGASRGIGRAIALAMAKQGASVAVLYAGNEKAASEVCGEIESLGAKAKSYRCDVSDYNAGMEVIKQIKEDLGDIDILVNNAGLPTTAYTRMSPEALTG